MTTFTIVALIAIIVILLFFIQNMDHTFHTDILKLVHSHEMELQRIVSSTDLIKDDEELNNAELDMMYMEDEDITAHMYAMSADGPDDYKLEALEEELQAMTVNYECSCTARDFLQDEVDNLKELVANLESINGFLNNETDKLNTQLGISYKAIEEKNEKIAKLQQQLKEAVTGNMITEVETMPFSWLKKHEDMDVIRVRAFFAKREYEAAGFGSPVHVCETNGLDTEASDYCSDIQIAITLNKEDIAKMSTMPFLKSIDCARTNHTIWKR